MKILNLFLAMMLFVGVAVAQNDSPYTTKTFSGQKLNRLEVKTSGGYIKFLFVQITGIPKSLKKRLKKG
jgi:YbbR domain-containing protein